jgi:sensor domain CHASE-containing protein
MDILQKMVSIRSKVFLMLLINILVLILLIYTVSITVISKSYLSIEKDEVSQNLERASYALNDVTSQLTTKLADWAFWDDTYNFVQDKNQAYKISNLGNPSISNLKINSMVFVNARGEIVFKKSIDLNSLEEVSSENLGSHILAHKELTTHEDVVSPVGGIVMLPDGPIIISSQPILTSTIQGPIMGSLIFTKFLNNSLIESIGQVTHLSLQLYDFNSTSLPEDVVFAKTKLPGNMNFITPLSSEKIAGYRVLNDLYGDPILIMKIDMPRPIYNQGLHTTNYFIAIAIILLILFGISVIFLLEKLVVSRLLYLSGEVEKISTFDDLSFRVKEGAKDEVGKLALVINRMLEALNTSRQTEEKAVEAIKKAGLDFQNQLIETEKMNKLMVDRELKMVELKKEIEELKKH